MSIIHTFIAVFLITKISEDFADAFYRHIVHEWCCVTCVFMYFRVLLCFVMLCKNMFCTVLMKGQGVIENVCSGECMKEG